MENNRRHSLKLPIQASWNRFMRKLLLSLAVAGAALCSWAADYNCLRVHLQDGSNVDIVLRKELKVSFADDRLVARGGDADVEVPSKNILRFEHVHVDTGGVEGRAADNAVAREGDTLIFSALPENCEVSVFDMAGRCVGARKASGTARIDLGAFGAGVYIVNVNNRSYKVTVR